MKEYEVNEKELMTQMKEEALKTPHVQIEIIVGENNQSSPFARVEIDGANNSLVAKAIITAEQVIKDLEDRNPLIYIAKSMYSIDEERSSTIEINKDKGDEEDE